MKLDMYTSCIYMCVCSSQGSVEGSPTATDDVVPVAKKSRGSDEREEDGEEVTDTPAVTEAAAKGEGGQGQGEAGEGSVQSRKRKREDEEAGNGGEGKSEGPEGKSVRLDPRGSGKLYNHVDTPYIYMYSVFFRNVFQGGQTNIFRNRGGRRLQLKCIKLKLAKAQGGQDHFRGGGGGGCPPQTP